MWFMLPTQSLKYPILKRSVPGQFLEYDPLKRRVMVEMFGKESSERSIPVRSLSELMEHLVHKVLILRASCHQLLPQGLISQDPIHHRRIRRHRMGTGREHYSQRESQPSCQPPHGVLLLQSSFMKRLYDPVTGPCRAAASLGVLVPKYQLHPLLRLF
ncbi:MAG: hypothetical protein AABY43_05910 [Candidatus Omnitrophota bacterium]